MNKKAGFTLTELIVTIVISGIVLTMVGYLLVTFNGLSKKVKADQNKNYEQNTIIRLVENYLNDANLNGEKISIKKENNTETLTYLEQQMIINNDEEVKLIINDETFSFKTINKIYMEIKEPKMLMLKITFNDEEIYELSLLVVGEIEEDSL